MIDHTYSIFVSMIREGKVREKKRRERRAEGVKGSIPVRAVFSSKILH